MIVFFDAAAYSLTSESLLNNLKITSNPNAGRFNLEISGPHQPRVILVTARDERGSIRGNQHWEALMVFIH